MNFADFYSGWDNPISFNLLWSGMIVCAVILALGIYYASGWKKRFSFIRFIEGNLMKSVIVIMIAGFVLYSWGYWEGNNAGNLIVMIPKAIVSSLGMFVSTSDMIDLKSEMKEDVLFMTLFTIVHFSAVLISILVILKVLGYKFTSFIKMHFQRPNQKAFVFWGINENSLMLAESIHEKEEREGREPGAFVFVELPSIDKYEYNPLVGLFNKHSIQRSYICRMENIGGYLIKAQHLFQDINEEGICHTSEDDIYQALGLDTLSRFIQHAEEVQFYFLSDSEQENLDNLMDVIKYYGADSFDRIPVNKIYCHARRNSLNSIIERTSKEGKIQFADSSFLSVLQLMKSAEYQPVRFVDTDTSKAIVTSSFHALVVGFGETGRDAFNFLYEFSAFLGADGELCPRSIHVVDAQLSERKTKFLNSCPALKGKEELHWWADMSVESQAFWDKYKELIGELNYIVITLPDDKMAAELAVSMYQMAYRYRTDLNHFKIFVRLKDTDSAQLLNHVSEYYKKGSDRSDRDTNILVSFGTYRSLFHIEIFDTDVVNADAKGFNTQYEVISREINPPEEEKKEEEGEKKEEKKPEKHVNGDIKQNCNNQQCISNVRHIDTKLTLAGAYGKDGILQKERLKALQEIAVREGRKYLNAQEGTSAYTLMENLSLCEHLRWNAKMELLGFVPYLNEEFPQAGKKDYAHKTHHCLVSCKELNNSLRDYKIYDWAVVELSFKYYSKKQTVRL